MSKFRLKKIVSRFTVWEIEAENPSEAIAKVERGGGHQIGFENGETNVAIVAEIMDSGVRNLVEEQQPKK